MFGGGSASSGSVRVYDILYASFRIAGVHAVAGRGLSPPQVDDGKYTLNTMLDAWSIERLMVPAVSRSAYTLTVSKSVYTIGPGADFEAAVRPSRIEHAGLTDVTSGVDLPVEVVTDQRWEAIPVKSVVSPYPDRIWYETTFPLANIHVYPVPSAANQLILYLWVLLSGVANVEDYIFLPPGYLEAIEYNLAVKLWGRFPRTVLTPAQVQEVKDTARLSKAAVKRMNTPIVELQCDPAVANIRSRYNVLTGQ